MAPPTVADAPAEVATSAAEEPTLKNYVDVRACLCVCALGPPSPLLLMQSRHSGPVLSHNLCKVLTPRVCVRVDGPALLVP
jgi:hypothetical protein